MVSKDDKIVKRVLFIFFGIGCFIIFAAGASKVFILRTWGIQTQGKIVSMRSERHYSSKSWYRPVYHFASLSFQDLQGKLHVMEVRMDNDEKNKWAAQPAVPFVYHLKTGAYSLGSEFPSWTESFIAGILLLPLGAFLIYRGIRR